MSEKTKNSANKPKQKRVQIIRNNLFMVKKVWQYTPMYIVWIMTDGILWGFNHAFSTIYTKKIFDSLDLGEPFSKILTVLVIAALFYLFLYIHQKFFWDYLRAIFDQKLMLGLKGEIFEKAASLDLACYDNPQFYTDYVFAMDELEKRSHEVINDISKLINRIIASVAILAVLGSIDPLFALAVFAANVIAVSFSVWGNRINFKHKKEKKPLERKYEYIKRVHYLADHSKEMRISDVGGNMERELDANMTDIRRMDVRYGKLYFFVYGISRVIRTAINAGVLVWMTYLLMVVKTILLGGFAAAVNALWKLSWVMTDLMDRIAKFPENSLYIERYMHFFAYEPKIKSGGGSVPAFKNLTLKGISFKYKDDYVLRDVNFEIKRGEKIAIVGYNGAGKTTLIKLLMRLYDTSGGEILWNGTDIREFGLSEYRSHIGAVFQDYKIFAATIAENVLGDDYDGSEESRAIVNEALQKSTFDGKLAELTESREGMDTPLTREFDKKGIGLSGGESQKIAIARVFARPYELIIMDEPSSALDPISEYNLNKSIIEFAGDRTVVFISHRLSTTRMADRIYMFDTGSLVEYGSHEELMDKNGKYAEMFNLQAEKYLAG